MSDPVIDALFNNAALLLVLSVVFEVLNFIPPKYHRVKPILNGILIALICVAIMSMPYTLHTGVVFDTRSILISITALIFGTFPTLITVLAASAMRIIMGGTGSLPGIAVILTSAAIGLAWRKWVFPKWKKLRWLSTYLMSVIVHVIMLACMLLIPYPESINIIKAIVLPVMLIYPVASVVLSILLFRQQELRDANERLKNSEEKHRRLFETMAQGVVYQSADG